MKVDIIGSVGSGKTTLSRKISIDFNVPCCELDNVMWIRSSQGDIRRTEEERESLFKSIINSDSWIIEGSPRKVFKEGFDKADYIILLDTPSSIRLFRIIIRWIKQRLDYEEYNTKPTWQMLCMMLKWHREFQKNRKSLLLELNQYGSKFVIIENDKDVYEFLSKSYSRGI